MASGTGTSQQQQRRGLPVKSLPVAYLAMAMAALLLLLPNSLRPVVPSQSTTTELSPNAPPDPKSPPIISTLNAGHSSTAGVGRRNGPQSPGQGPGTGEKRKLAPAPAPRGCPFGYGVPLRQVESFYSAPCAKAWKGDNGGATSRGVTATQVNVGFLMQLVGTTGNGGAVPADPSSTNDQMLRTYSVWQKYFNQRMQFWGRRVQFYYVPPDGDSSGTTRADTAVDTYKAFAAMQETAPGALAELTRRKVVTFTMQQASQATYLRHRPYLWSFTPDGTRLARMGAEYLCKRLADHPPFPRATGDVPIDATPGAGVDPTKNRKFGVLALEGADYNNVGFFKSEVQRRCGIDPSDIVDVRYHADPAPTAQEIATSMQTLKAAHVSTVVYLGDLLTGGAWTTSASAQAYYPEWFIPGFGGVEAAPYARAFEQQQWAHAFGFSTYEVPTMRNDHECFRAFHEIDPAHDPDAQACAAMWGHVVQMMSGIQQAGPHLTPETFAAGMMSFPHLSPLPHWKVTGNYGATDYTYPDYAIEIYWDRDAIAPYDNSQGAYRYVYTRRYTDDEWPVGQPVLRNGILIKPAG